MTTIFCRRHTCQNSFIPWELAIFCGAIMGFDDQHYALFASAVPVYLLEGSIGVFCFNSEFVPITPNLHLRDLTRFGRCVLKVRPRPLIAASLGLQIVRHQTAVWLLSSLINPRPGA
jgi:hypothetical protein